MRFALMVFVFSTVLNTAAAEWQVQVVDYSGEGDPAIAVDSEGRPRIAYFLEDYGAEYARYNGFGWVIESIYQPSYGNTGYFDIVVDDSDISHVVFVDHFRQGLPMLWRTAFRTAGQ